MNEDVKSENLRIHSRADELIACLEGEIAKRDEELAACRVAVENCEVFRARITELEARIVWLECEVQVNAEPVPESKAQGVVMLSRDAIREVFMRNGFTVKEGQADLKPYVYAAAEELLRLSAPVQQVSVQSVCQECNGEGTDRSSYVPLKHRDLDDCKACGGTGRLAAAPAAPAADAGLVDMYRHLQKVTPYRFKKIQDASITDGGDVMYFHKDRFDAALLADMAGHCAAKGVV